MIAVGNPYATNKPKGKKRKGKILIQKDYNQLRQILTIAIAIAIENKHLPCLVGEDPLLVSPSLSLSSLLSPSEGEEDGCRREDAILVFVAVVVFAVIGDLLLLLVGL